MVPSPRRFQSLIVVSAASVALLAAGCRIQSFSQTQSVQLDVNGFPEKIICKNGEGGVDQEALAYTFVPPAVKVTTKDLTALKGKYTLLEPSPTLVEGTRFDVCPENNGQVSLRRIIQRLPAPGFAFSMRYNEYIPDDLGPNPGLTAALEEDDYTGIRMLISNPKDPKRSFLLLGGKKGEASFMSLSEYNAKKTKPENVTKNSRAWVGDLVAGDPFVPKVTKAHRTIEAPDFRMVLTYEFTGGVGMYIGYKWQMLELMDHRPTVQPSVDLTIDDPEVLARTIVVHPSHHGLMDTYDFMFDKGSVGDQPPGCEDPDGKSFALCYAIEGIGDGLHFLSKEKGAAEPSLKVKLKCNLGDNRKGPEGCDTADVISVPSAP